MCVLTSNQVLPIANSLSSRASFWRCSTLGSVPEHTFYDNKFNPKTCHNRTVPRGTTSKKRPVFIWATMQRIVVIPCRRFGTDRLSRSVGKELLLHAA